MPTAGTRGWLLPASLLVVVAGLVVRRRQPRTDPVRAGIVLWGTWLIVFGVAFTVSATINSYYLAALAPPVAGLFGIAAALAWERRHERSTRVALVGMVLVTAGYAVWLLPGTGTGLPAWLRPTVLVLGIAVVVALVATCSCAVPAVCGWWPMAVVGVGLTAVLVPAVASESVVANIWDRSTPLSNPRRKPNSPGPSSAPPADDLLVAHPRAGAGRRARSHRHADLGPGGTLHLCHGAGGAAHRWVQRDAAPEPSVRRLASEVAAGDFHLVITAAASDDPRVAWVVAHCLKVPTPANAADTGVVLPVAIHYCTPVVAAGPAHKVLGGSVPRCGGLR